MARSRFVEPSLLGCFSGRGRGPGPKNGLGFVEPSLLGCFSGRGQGSRGAKNGDSSGASSALQGKRRTAKAAEQAPLYKAKDKRPKQRSKLRSTKRGCSIRVPIIAPSSPRRRGSSDFAWPSRETLDSRLRGNDERGATRRAAEQAPLYKAKDKRPKQRSKLRSTKRRATAGLYSSPSPSARPPSPTCSKRSVFVAP